MKRAGDILSTLFDEGFVKKAHRYSNLFDSWEDITAKNGIAAAAAHSRIKDLDKGLLIIEMDHPGWKQILQTKQAKLLNDFNIRFPEMNISGISLMLGSGKQGEAEKTETQEYPVTQEQSAVICEPAETSYAAIMDESTASDIEAIKDDELREKLIKLGQTIAEREKG